MSAVCVQTGSLFFFFLLNCVFLLFFALVHFALRTYQADEQKEHEKCSSQDSLTVNVTISYR